MQTCSNLFEVQVSKLISSFPSPFSSSARGNNKLAPPIHLLLIRKARVHSSFLFDVLESEIAILDRYVRK